MCHLIIFLRTANPVSYSLKDHVKFKRRKFLNKSIQPLFAARVKLLSKHQLMNVLGVTINCRTNIGSTILINPKNKMRQRYQGKRQQKSRCEQLRKYREQWCSATQLVTLVLLLKTNLARKIRNFTRSWNMYKK